MKPTNGLRKLLLVAILSYSGLIAFAQTPAPTTTPNVVFKSGFAAYQAGDYSLAITQFTLAITIDPTRNYFYYNRGMAHKALGNTAAAIADFKRSNELKQTAEVYYQLGIIYYDKQDYPQAQIEFENAKLMRDDIERMNFCLGMIYLRDNKLEEALKCFTDYTITPRNSADAYYYRGLAEAKLNKYEEAINSFKLALRYKDNDWKVYIKMYEFYLALGDKQNALNSITMVIEIGETKVEYYEKRAELYKELGFDFKYDEDMEVIKKLKESPVADQKKS